MSALSPRTVRLQIVILVMIGLTVSSLVFAELAAKESSWVTVDADKRIDRRVSIDEELGVYLVRIGSRTIALSNHGPWYNELVVYCPSSQLFETPASGSKFDIYGRYFAGPAPRGMSRFPSRIVGDEVQIEPHELIAGPSRAVTRKKALLPVGPYCIPT